MVASRPLLLGLFACVALATPASASVISGTVTGGTAFTAGGVFVQLTPPLGNPFGPPNSVGNDNFQRPNLYAFNEDQNIVLGAPLTVNVVPSGPLTLPAGTTVASHYVFFDPNQTQDIIGTVDFDADVLAIITATGTLLASDFLANTGVNYLNPGARGLEAGDSVTISGPRQIRFATSAATPGDYVRVLTKFSPLAAVPEPTCLALFGVGLVAVGVVRRVRRHVA